MAADFTIAQFDRFHQLAGRVVRRQAIVLALLGLVCLATPTAAVENGPQGVVRQFCQVDGLGQRVSVPGWADIAPLVEWPLEPAWDHAILITGYTVGSPRATDHGVFVVEVRYDVVGQVSALGLDTAVHVETVNFRVHAPTVGWRIIGPPPPPHIFGTRVDVDRMRRSFERGGANFLPNSLFIWQMFRSAGWNVPFERTIDLRNDVAYRPVDRPSAGDVVVYLRDEQPYHAGLLEADGRVVSSTLNAGIVRTPPDAFAGEIRYERLVQPAPQSTVTPSVHATANRPRRAIHHPQPLRRKTPGSTKQKVKGKKGRHRAAQPSPRVRVQPRVGVTPKGAHPTPVATAASS